MGLIYVDVTIRNPADPTRSWVGPFLVDTGAIDSLVPWPRLEAIGLEPKGQRVYETADGRKITTDVTTSDIEVMGEITAGLILQNQRLRKLPSVRLMAVEHPRVPLASARRSMGR